VLIGLAMHIGVAFTWSTVFLAGLLLSDTLRRHIATPFGAFTVAAAYGPMIWIIMSVLVIPTVAHRPPNPITYRWWVQFFGHIFFVGMPIVYSFRST
jgi:hypothetical protein